MTVALVQVSLVLKTYLVFGPDHLIGKLTDARELLPWDKKYLSSELGPGCELKGQGSHLPIVATDMQGYNPFQTDLFNSESIPTQFKLPSSSLAYT